MPREWQALQRNQGVEAMALDSSGRIVAIEDGSPLQVSGRAAWRFDPPSGASIIAESLTYSTAFAVAPGDASAGTDGRVYVLEREITGRGLTARIVRVAESADGSLSADAVLDLGDSLPLANYEGMTADPYTTSGQRFILVSDGDDNARSIIVDIRAPDCTFVS